MLQLWPVKYDKIIYLIEQEGKNLQQTADKVGFSKQWVKQIHVKYGTKPYSEILAERRKARPPKPKKDPYVIAVRRQGRDPYTTFICKVCELPTHPRRNWKHRGKLPKYCSVECRNKDVRSFNHLAVDKDRRGATVKDSG